MEFIDPREVNEFKELTDKFSSISKVSRFSSSL